MDLQKIPMRMKKKSFRILFYPMIVAIFGQLFFYPFQNTYRISAGVIALNIVVLVEKDISPFVISTISGVFIVLMRSMMSVVFNGFTIGQAVAEHIITLAFYLPYGLMGAGFSVSDYRYQPVSAGFILMVMDWQGNVVEAVARQEVQGSIVESILFTSFVRSLLAVSLLAVYQYQKLFIVERDHQKRYTQLNILISDIRAEAFYLEKSISDINDVMRKSYHLYETHREEEPEVSGTALEIARSIHEIGKDYKRMLMGLESLIDHTEKQDEMTLSNVIHIIDDNTQHILERSGKRIIIRFDVSFNCPIKQYYNLFAILNNLIVNAVDACEADDFLFIQSRKLPTSIEFTVTDSGCGVDPELLPYIFNAGFTTKFDEITGEASTGIGLNHVKNIIDSMGGTIRVESQQGKGTTFVFTLPWESL